MAREMRYRLSALLAMSVDAQVNCVRIRRIWLPLANTTSHMLAIKRPCVSASQVGSVAGPQAQNSPLALPMPSKKAEGYFVYLLECADGTLYTGITTDVPRRLAEHISGKGGARFTRAKKAKRIIYTEPHENRSSALKREAEIKKWSRSKKLILSRSAG